MQEKDIERFLCEQVKKLGGKAYKFVSPGCAGVPDRLVVLPGGAVAFVEVKATGKNLRPLQVAKMNELKGLGCRYFVVDSKEKIKIFLGRVGVKN